MVGGIGRQTEESIYSGFNICINKTARCRSVRWGVGVGVSVKGCPLRLTHRVNYKTGLFLEKGDGRQCQYESKGCLLLTVDDIDGLENSTWAWMTKKIGLAPTQCTV